MTPEEQTDASFRHWAVVELMGHQKIAGLVEATQIAGAPFLRINVPNAAGATRFSRFYSPSSVYCISPCDKQIAIGVALKLDAEPVQRYQLAELANTKPAQGSFYDPEEDPEH